MNALAFVSGFVDGFGWTRLKWHIVALLPGELRFNAQHWLTDRTYLRTLRNRPEGKSWSEVKCEWDHESYEIWDARCQFQSDRLITRASRLRIAIPRRPLEDDDENWIRSSIDGQWFLADEGYNKLRAAVREEERLQREDRKGRFENSRVVLLFAFLGGSWYPALQGIRNAIDWLGK